MELGECYDHLFLGNDLFLVHREGVDVVHLGARERRRVITHDNPRKPYHRLLLMAECIVLVRVGPRGEDREACCLTAAGPPSRWQAFDGALEPALHWLYDVREDSITRWRCPALTKSQTRA